MDKKILEGFYIENKLEVSSIARLTQETPERIVEMLKEYDIPFRCRFSNVPENKSTIIGIDYQRRRVGEYVQIDTNDGWVFEHRYMWEQANGKIPTGWVIRYINGIKDDNRLENLEAVPRKGYNTRSSQDASNLRIIALENEVKELKAMVEVYEEFVQNS